MKFNSSVFDIWAFRRVQAEAQFLVLRTSQLKADRHFNSGRFWQIPCGVFAPTESVLAGIDLVLGHHRLNAQAVWAAEHTYTIYNRRFEEIEVISVFAAEVALASESVVLDPAEHSECEWLPYAAALDRVHYRGLKDGLRSTQEYVTGPSGAAPELQLR